MAVGWGGGGVQIGVGGRWQLDWGGGVQIGMGERWQLVGGGGGTDWGGRKVAVGWGGGGYRLGLEEGGS